MKKQLPTDAIANELSGSSVFFPQADERPDNTPVPSQEKSAAGPTSPPHQAATRQPSHQQTKQASDQAFMPPRHHDTVTPRQHTTTVDADAETTPETRLDSLRQAVKQLGKEAATHRFTQAEKRQIADIVYTYSRQAVRTSENEITRIAVNWLLLDYRERGAHSVLARVLDALHG